MAVSGERRPTLFYFPSHQYRYMDKFFGGRSIERINQNLMSLPDDISNPGKLNVTLAEIFQRVQNASQDLHQSGKSNRPVNDAIKGLQADPNFEFKQLLEVLNVDVSMELAVTYLIDNGTLRKPFYTRNQIRRSLRGIYPADPNVRVNNSVISFSETPGDYWVMPTAVDIGRNATGIPEVVIFDSHIGLPRDARREADLYKTIAKAKREPGVDTLKLALLDIASHWKIDHREEIASIGDDTPIDLIYVMNHPHRYVPGYRRTIRAGFTGYGETVVVTLGFLTGRFTDYQKWEQAYEEVDRLPLRMR